MARKEQTIVMTLTDKCKQDFEKWLIHEFTAHQYLRDWLFHKLPFSMQYGVYVDFFDSKGIIISLGYAYFFDEEMFSWVITIGLDEVYSGDEDERHEAREEAIKQANEIYNKQK